MTKRDLGPLILGGLAVAVVGLLLVAGSNERDVAKGKVPWRESLDPGLRVYWDSMEGRAAPGLEGLEDWMGTDGRSWEDFRGKVVLVDYWGTWCPPCVKAIPKLNELHEKYAEAGLVVLGIHSAQGASKMRPFVLGRKLPYAFAADVDGVFGEALHVSYYPSYFFVGRDGNLRVAGAHPYKLDEIAQTLLGEPVEG